MARAMKDSGIEWIGEIPEGWETARGKGILTLLERPVLADDGVITCFRDGEVTLRSKRREEGFTFSLQEVGYQGIEPGDLVVHGMDGFAGAIGISDARGKATPVLNVMDSSQNKRFLMYYLRCAAHCGLFQSLATGIRVRSCDTNWNKLKAILYLVPPLEEQDAIVSFLDTECARIDAVIEQTRASIEEYKKLKQSVITQAVTKGIRPGRKMKDSGVEWIGEIPEEWSINPLGKGLELIQTGPFGSQLHADEYINNGIVVVNPANISNGEIIPDEKCTITREKAQELSRHMLKMGDIVFGRRGEMGRSACVIDSSHEYFCGTGCLQIRCNEALKPRYASYYLQNPCIKQYLELHAVGTTMQNLNTTIVSGIPIVYGTPSEQEEIVDYIDCKRAEIDQLICAKQQFLSELESYKKSLIFEYVTGKKET